MAKISNKEKLEALKEWLKENNIPFIENHKSNFGVTIDVKIPSLKIAVFLSDGNDDAKYNATLSNGKTKLYHIYKPFFIRESETKKFVMEKIQNCCYDQMLKMQKRFEKKQGGLSMTKQEYLAIEKSIYDKIASLYNKIHDVQEEYVKSNSIIKPGTSVKTSRGKEGVLLGYEFFNGDVKPVVVSNKGKKKKRIYMFSGDTVEVIEGNTGYKLSDKEYKKLLNELDIL